MDSGSAARLLPGIFQDAIGASPPLSALVELMATMQSSVEGSARGFPQVLSPWQAPERFVPMLERWVGLEPGMAVDELHTRRLVNAAASLWRARGTAPGMVRLLELATGVRGFRIEQGNAPFTILVHAPAAAREQGQRVRRLVVWMKPAAVQLQGIEFAEGGT